VDGTRQFVRPTAAMVRRGTQVQGRCAAARLGEAKQAGSFESVPSADRERNEASMGAVQHHRQPADEWLLVTGPLACPWIEE